MDEQIKEAISYLKYALQMEKDGKVPIDAIKNALQILKESNDCNTKDDDCWIEWNGGECPVDDDVMVEIELRCGTKNGKVASYWDWRWSDIVPFTDIIKYRVVKDQK